MLGRLVAVGIISHIRYLHLGDFVDAVAIVAVIIYRRHHKDRIQHCGEFFATSHCLHQSLDIVED